MILDLPEGHDCAAENCWWEVGFHKEGYCCAECGCCGDPACCPGGCDCRWSAGLCMIAGDVVGPGRLPL